MQTIKLYIYKKNLDLDCMSASEAIKHFMHKDKLVHLQRFLCWHIQVASELSKEAIIETLTTNTYLLLNPNKEAYFIDELPQKQSSNTSVHVSVKSTLKAEYPELAETLTAKCGLPISRLEKSIEWLCQVAIPDAEKATAYVEQELLNTTSYSQGILVNPIYEQYSIKENSLQHS